MMKLPLHLSLLASSLLLLLGEQAILIESYTIRVCQNKDCCQRFQGKATNLVETMEMLLPDDVTVETSGCLSQCGHGPNIQIQRKKKNDDEVLHHHVETATSVAAIFSDEFEIHPTLLAASNVMEKAAKAKSNNDKLAFLNSVITALQKKPELLDTKTMAHALAMRAQVLLDQREFAVAKQDARDALSVNPTQRMAWRILADAEEGQENVEGAIVALQNWSKTDPRYATKVRNEISRLRLMTGNGGAGGLAAATP